jgi:hypothetical protein
MALAFDLAHHPPHWLRSARLPDEVFLRPERHSLSPAASIVLRATHHLGYLRRLPVRRTGAAISSATPSAHRGDVAADVVLQVREDSKSVASCRRRLSACPPSSTPALGSAAIAVSVAAWVAFCAGWGPLLRARWERGREPNREHASSQHPVSSNGWPRFVICLSGSSLIRLGRPTRPAPLSCGRSRILVTPVCFTTLPKTRLLISTRRSLAQVAMPDPFALLATGRRFGVV